MGGGCRPRFPNGLKLVSPIGVEYASHSNFSPFTSHFSLDDSIRKTSIHEVTHHLLGIKVVGEAELDLAGLVQ